MYWTVDDSSDTVEIGLEVESSGWIGWGISPNGQMVNSDVIVAWIEDDEDQTPYLKNYYTTSNRYDGMFWFDVSAFCDFSCFSHKCTTSTLFLFCF